MSEIKNLENTAAIDKLKELVKQIEVCLFASNLNDNDGSTCRPMQALKVCDQGNIWFFSEKGSLKNKEIEEDKNVQLYFSDPRKSSYLIVNGEAEIKLNRDKIEELWHPMAKIWFKEGKDDPTISVIKVKPTSVYYWDTDGNRMINFLKVAASIATGVDLVKGNEGTLNV